MTTIYSTCALPGCNLPVTNWRLRCCCISHSRRYGGKRSKGTALAVDKIQIPEPLKISPLPKSPKVKTIPSKYKDWSAEKKGKYIAYMVARRKKRDKSMPAWANKDAIKEIYIKARQLTEETGIKYEVDHIIPSNHPLVCGLHVETNLQILTEFENISKKNRFEI